MTIKLYHYTSKPLKKIIKRNYLDKFWFVYEKNKPYGFWLSVENEDSAYNWGSFCDNEVMRYRIKYKYQVFIDPNANILKIESPQALKKFVIHYGFYKVFDDSHPIEKWKKKTKELQEQKHKCFSNFPDFYMTQFSKKSLDPIKIDWLELYKLYQGIYIAPYQNDFRYDWEWYYGWDVASACIWDINCIDSFILEEK